MLDDPCPSCGHRRHRNHGLKVDPEAPGLVELWKGEGEFFMRVIAKVGTVVLAALMIAGLMVSLHVHV